MSCFQRFRDFIAVKILFLLKRLLFFSRTFAFSLQSLQILQNSALLSRKKPHFRSVCKPKLEYVFPHLPPLFLGGGKYKISSFRPLFSNHLPISKKSSTFAYVKSAYNTISLILRHDLIYQLLCRRARFIRTSIGGLDFFYPFRNGIQNPDFFCLYRANQDNKKY